MNKSKELADGVREKFVQAMSTDTNVVDSFCPCFLNDFCRLVFFIVPLIIQVTFPILIISTGGWNDNQAFTPNIYNSTLADSTPFFPISCNHSTATTDCLDTIIIFIKNSNIMLGLTAAVAGALIRAAEQLYRGLCTKDYINRYLLPTLEINSADNMQEMRVINKPTTTPTLLAHRNKVFVLTGLFFIAGLELYFKLLDSPSTLENCVLPSSDNMLVFDSDCLDEFTKNHTAGTGTLAASAGLLLAYTVFEAAKTTCHTIFNIKDITINTVNYCWSGFKTVKKFFCDPAPNPQQPTETTPLTLGSSSKPSHSIN